MHSEAATMTEDKALRQQLVDLLHGRGAHEVGGAGHRRARAIAQPEISHAEQSIPDIAGRSAATGGQARHRQERRVAIGAGVAAEWWPRQHAVEVEGERGAIRPGW